MRSFDRLKCGSYEEFAEDQPRMMRLERETDPAAVYEEILCLAN